MSYNSSPTRNFSDYSKKAQIINELKKEILEQKQKEEEYEELFNEVKILETRIDNLALEKEKNELEQKSKQSNYLNTILELKAEMDSLQSALRQKKIEFQELQGENLSLNQMNEIKNNELARMKAEMKATKEKNIQFKEKRHLDSQNSQKISMEKSENEIEINKLGKEIENLAKKNLDDEKRLQELEFEIQRIESMNFQNQKNNKAQENDFPLKLHQLNAQEKNIMQLKAQSQALQKEIEKNEQRNEDIKKEISQGNQMIQKEKSKQVELQTTLINMDKSLRKKQEELDKYSHILQDVDLLFSKNKEILNNTNTDYNLLVNHLNLLLQEKDNILNGLGSLISEDENLIKLLEIGFSQ